MAHRKGSACVPTLYDWLTVLESTATQTCFETLYVRENVGTGLAYNYLAVLTGGTEDDRLHHFFAQVALVTVGETFLLLSLTLLAYFPIKFVARSGLNTLRI